MKQILQYKASVINVKHYKILRLRGTRPDCIAVINMKASPKKHLNDFYAREKKKCQHPKFLFFDKSEKSSFFKFYFLTKYNFNVLILVHSLFD